jgi:hypothetical protein
VHIRAKVRTSSGSSPGGSWYCSVGMQRNTRTPRPDVEATDELARLATFHPT